MQRPEFMHETTGPKPDSTLQPRNNKLHETVRRLIINMKALGQPGHVDEDIVRGHH